MRKIKLTTVGDQAQMKKYGWIVLAAGIFVTLVAAFFFLDRRNEISLTIQSWGSVGMVLAILFMAFLCLTPIPSEGLVVLYLKIYGVYLGTFLAWLGSNLSSLVIFVIARYYGQRLMEKLVTAERFHRVDDWVKRKGAWGLFMARLLPIPAFLVNYIAGLIPSVRFWPYMWTAALSIIPYYVGTALVFLGVVRETWIWLIIGGMAMAAFWGLGVALNRRPLR